MKYIFALVCLIAFASSGDTCYTNKWSDLTDADCTDAKTDAWIVK